jgi:hypothetical protein
VNAHICGLFWCLFWLAFWIPSCTILLPYNLPSKKWKFLISAVRLCNHLFFLLQAQSPLILSRIFQVSCFSQSHGYSPLNIKIFPHFLEPHSRGDVSKLHQRILTVRFVIYFGISIACIFIQSPHSVRKDLLDWNMYIVVSK